MAGTSVTRDEDGFVEVQLVTARGSAYMPLWSEDLPELLRALWDAMTDDERESSGITD